MITLTQWSADAERQELLRKLLNDPVMQEALTLARAQCTPKAREVDNPDHMLTLYALDHSRATGWYAALNFLSHLSSVSQKIEPKAQQPWKHTETSKTKK
jgi:hypothetical protein